MKVIITGSTGMVGKGVLLECLEDDRVNEILALNRNSLGINHPKLKEVLLKDFGKSDSIKSEMVGYDAVFFCMGVSSGGMDADLYQKITYGHTLAVAKTFHSVNPGATFNYVSGQGTDSTEKGRSRWGRVKGKTENDLMRMGFGKAFMFRPGVIRPLNGIKSRTANYQIALTLIKPFWPLLSWLMGESMTDTTRIGKAMINSVAMDSGTKVLEPRDINSLARGE